MQEKSCQLFFNPINVKTAKQIGSIFCVNSNDPSLKTVNVLKKIKIFFENISVKKENLAKFVIFIFSKCMRGLKKIRNKKLRLCPEKWREATEAPVNPMVFSINNLHAPLPLW